MVEEDNPYEVAVKQLANAAELINLDPGVHDILKNPERVLEVSVPIKLDNGKIKVFKGFRVQHSLARGPAKGDRRPCNRQPRHGPSIPRMGTLPPCR